MEKQNFVNEHEEKAKNGDCESQLELGKCFLYGRGTENDDAQAYYWFTKAAEQGSEIAKMYQGHCVLYGLGVEKDEKTGWSMLDAALNFNYPDEGESQPLAEYSDFTNDDLCQLFLDLGDALENSLGVYRNYKFAVYYFQMLESWGRPIGTERMKHYKKGLFGWKKID